MNDRVLTILTAQTVLVLGVVGLIDAIRDDDTGLAVLFGLILAGVLNLARSRTRAGSVALRRDLSYWLERTAPTTGETSDDLANRAVSRLRAGFSPLPENE